MVNVRMVGPRRVERWLSGPDRLLAVDSADGPGIAPAEAAGAQRVTATAAVQRADASHMIAGAIAGLLLLGAWGVVALSMFVVIRVALAQGVALGPAVLLASPALIVPLWKTQSVLRRPTMQGALLGHLWVLNGSAGWAVVALGGIWWAGALQTALSGSRTGLLVALLTAGFIPVYGTLVALNWWLVFRWRR